MILFRLFAVLLSLGLLPAFPQDAVGPFGTEAQAPVPDAHPATLPASSGDSTAAPLVATEPKNPVEEKTYDLGKEVISAPARKFTRKESDQVARMPLKNLENPQAYTVVPKELISEQMAVDYNSAFKNIPGASKNVQWMQGATRFFSRGFLSEADVRNGLSLNVVTDFDPVNVERIEAIRGPAGTLFGSGSGISYGGLFNRVTKTPFETFRGEVSYSGGSWNLSRLTADVNTPLNPEKTLLLRVNFARHSEGSFQDHGFADNWALAPVLTYRVNDRLTLNMDIEAYQRVGTSIPQMYVGDVSAKSIEDLGVDYRRSFLNNSLRTETPTYGATAKADYRLGSGWSSETMVSYNSSAADLVSIYLYAFNDSQAVRTYDLQNWKVYTQQVQQNIRGEFRLGPVRNQALAGLSVSNKNYSWPYMIASDTLNYRNPGAAYNVNIDGVRAKTGALPANMWIEEYYTYSAYASDALHLGPFTALLGVRWDRFDNRGSTDGTVPAEGTYEQDAFSPKLGLVYQIVKDRLSLFSNYMSGYRNVNGRSFDGDNFIPEQAYQTEVGVKSDFMGGLVTGTTSLYDIQVRDVVRSDPGHPGFSMQNGTQSSRGVEVDLAAHPLRGLSVVAGYAYNQSELEKADSDVEGRRPSSAGPEQTANFWASYELLTGAAKGVGLGLGANYAGEAFHANTDAFEFTVPEYLLWDATLFYDRPAYRIGFKVDNLTNQKYWSPANLQPGPLRRVMGNFTYRF